MEAQHLMKQYTPKVRWGTSNKYAPIWGKKIVNFMVRKFDKNIIPTFTKVLVIFIIVMIPFRLHSTPWDVTLWPSPMGLQGHSKKKVHV